MSETNRQELGSHCASEPIAIVGSACRFPGGSRTPSKLWELLRQPRDILQEFDPDRLNLKRFYHANGETHGSTDVLNKSFLLEEDIRLFDASFFGISPVEAAGMDPQQRILLETVYEATETAGITLKKLKGSLTSVHVGVMTNDWANIQRRDPETMPQYTATAIAGSIISNRISYVFDLKGVSETIDTACSSSLVALHNAARTLQNRDSDAAIVAGVNLILDPDPFICESKLHMLSPDSRSRMWDKSANGYARGEGVAAVYMKTLSQALRDGDHIEGIIRSTFVNSDGLSSGLTMPSASAQAALIRQTYLKAGLNPVKDRPQYFECHGTGTPAGDPIEARAISEAFIPRHGSSEDAATVDNPIYVGSIKTVIGHLEGCAGLAGVMKVLLSLKHRTIPPNLWFNELNPAISRYYGPLKISTTALPWPELPVGVPFRASVNSFGFGGTNAHAIIESFDSSNGHSHCQQQTARIIQNADKTKNDEVPGPLLISANTGASLLRTVDAFAQYLRQHPGLSLQDVSSFLHARRSTHRTRAHFSGVSRQEVLESMENFIRTHSSDGKSSVHENKIGYSPQLLDPKEVPGILGVFTGQGAQWPAMGRELMAKSPFFRKTIANCEAVLRSLPLQDAPSWSLAEELMLDASKSRLSQAEISQPLCTAVQLALVSLLTISGIQFDAVVGHSSGEIAAAYASGIITLRGAMQIAYYRGYHAKLASGRQGQQGGMMAVGISMDKALQFCQRAEFKGRIQVAASNAPQSVTLSGDRDAITMAKQILDDDGTFARQLKVDTAYHSYHMLPCAKPYLESLLACDIEVRRPRPGKCIWSSSVRGDTQLLREDGNLDSLKGPYWVDNMVQTVLFSRAVQSSIWHGGPFDLVIEVGPHPALKGPIEQTLKAIHGFVPPYTGVLKRGTNDVETFSAALGSVWARLGPAFINLPGYQMAFCQPESRPPATPRAIEDFPLYLWDHEQIYWHESRMSRKYRTGRDMSHELLGRRAPDDNEREMRWRNVLKVSELPWTQGHKVLGEVLLPGAAYISMALEAGRSLAVDRGRTVKLLEVSHVDILRPVVVPDDKDGTETVFTAQLLDDDVSPSGKSRSVLRASFSFYIFNSSANTSAVHACSGNILVYLDTASESEANSGMLQLPLRGPRASNLVDIDCEGVYSLFGRIGLEYSDVFRRIKASSRRLGHATASAAWDDGSLNDHYIIHPAILDAAFQSMFIARAHPNSGQISSALLPSRIEHVKVVPSSSLLSKLQRQQTINAEFDSWVLNQTATSMTGDINVYDSDTGSPLLQVEGFGVKMVGELDASNDRLLFSKTSWGPDVSLMGLADPIRNAAADAAVLSSAEASERLSLFYVRQIMDEISIQDRSDATWYHKRMLESFDQHLEKVKNDQHLHLRTEWLSDDWTVIQALDDTNPDAVELQMLHAVGKNMLSVIRGEKHMLEVMRVNNLLDRFYADDKGMQQVNHFLASALQQIVFKFPRCKILEIGAGTGATTWEVMNAIDDAFDTYTYTDLSVGFFVNAAEKFSRFRQKMVFKTLDVEGDLAAQGYLTHSYDIIVAANVLHATRDLSTTLRNVRWLLKPGGYLLLNETTGSQSLRATFNFGGLEGWWLAEEEERRFSPLLSPVDWDMRLQDAGFLGADKVIHDIPNEPKQQTSLIVSQAVDDSFFAQRDPLSTTAALSPVQEPVLLIGGKTLATSKLIKEVQRLLYRRCRRNVKHVDHLEGLEAKFLSPRCDVISLQEMDEPLFATPMTTKRLATLQNLMICTENLLWVTNAQSSNSPSPRASMFRGISRVMAAEMPQIHSQVFGLEAGTAPTVAARHLVEAMLRLREHTVFNGGDNIDDGDRHLLWSHEPEIDLLANGQMMIPRVKLDSPLNEAYNASARAITKTVDANHVPVQVVAGPVKMKLQSSANATGYAEPANDASVRRVHIQVQHALHFPEDLSKKSLYLVCGYTKIDPASIAARAPVMALSTENASIVDAENTAVVNLDHDHVTPAVLLHAAQHLAMQAIDALIKDQDHPTTLLYGAEKSLADLVSARLAQRGAHAYFASSGGDVSEDWLKIHPLCSKFSASKLIPFGVGAFIDCLGSAESASASNVLQSCLPRSCIVRQLDAGLIRQASKDTATLLDDAYSYAKTAKIPESSQHTNVVVIPAADLAGTHTHVLRNKTYVTDWQARGSLLVTIPSLETRGLFKADKTYLMVGAAGGLGTSICHWMLYNGARHVVITSRNPQGDPGMLEAARLCGATVRIVQMDVCSRPSIDHVIDNIRGTMPPIAGVCNAAMVLSDKLFLDMNIDQFNSVLGPKVDGTEHLDSIFAHESLDFFVVLGSLASIANNVGQSNYHCANLFMESLVAQRRSRGLAASIIHIGHVCDAGYVARNSKVNPQIESKREDLRSINLSETDVHYAFAQAVRGGNPNSTCGSHNIIMGIEPPTHPRDPTKRQAIWLSDPRMGHMVPPSSLQSQRGEIEHTSAASSSVKQQVNEAQTENDAVSIVLKAFCSNLESILLLPPGSIEKDSVQRPVIDLGIDSLVAVEIRTWLLRELGVEVPVVRILGGDTVAQLCASVVKLMARNENKMTQVREVPQESPTLLLNLEGKATAKMDAAIEASAGVIEVNTETVTDTLVHPISEKILLDIVSLPLSSASSEDDDNSQKDASSTDSRPTAGSIETDQVNRSGQYETFSSLNTEQAKEFHAKPDVIREAPMSPAQSRIWFLSKHMAEPDAYNMVFHYRVHGPLSMMRLRHAMQTVTRHHECLRMCFYSHTENGHPMQGLMDTPAFEMSHINNSEENDVQRELIRLKTREWDIENGQTLELVVLSRQDEPEEHSLLFGYHHIVMDAVSWHIFLADLDKAYGMQALDKKAAGSHLDLTEMQLLQDVSGALEKPLAFWEAEFETLPEALPPLPMALVSSWQVAQQSPISKSCTGSQRSHRVVQELGKDQFRAIKETCERLRISPFSLNIAVLQVLLARLANTEDVCIGIVDANRNDARSAQMVACFVNMLPLRSRVSGKATLEGIARAAFRKALLAFAHGSVPLDKILDRVKAPRSTGATPLFQVAMNYRPNTTMAWDMALGNECRMELSPYDIKDADNPFVISVLISEIVGGGLGIELYCQKALYTLEGSQALLDSYLLVLDSFTSAPAQHVDECVVYNPIEVDQAIKLGKGPEMDFGWPATMSERIMDMCRLHRCGPAIKDGQVELSYGQLAAKVHDAANAFLAAGCVVGSRIAVLCDPTVDAIVAMLAILHIGAVYVPLDSSLPTARHSAMISSSKPELIVSQEATHERVQDLRRVVSVEWPGVECRIDKASVSQESRSNLGEATVSEPRTIDPDSPAILLYTSGSTGIPKGVVLSQANFANHIALKSSILGLGRGECVLQQSSLGFDMSLVQTFCALANGGCLIIVPADARRDPVELTSLICHHKVSLTVATPSEYLTWLQYGTKSLKQNTAWRHVCLGGEPVTQQLKDELRRLDLEGLTLTNCYGPTEITAAASFQTIHLGEHGEQIKDEWARYAVGKALPNYSVRILGPARLLLPVNHTGEICIGGSGVALEYLGSSEETLSKFILDEGQRFYCTGDKGRLLPDGTLLCLGRLEGDNQVKLRGLRIELEEVETALIQASGGLFHGAVASRRGDVLVAHVTLSPGERANNVGDGEITTILRQLTKVLPQYFVPAAIVILPQLPTNANGKLDRKAIAALPLPQRGETTLHAALGQEKMTVRQGELRLLWEQVLPTEGTSRIGPSSDFFLSGGNSLLLMKLQAAIRESMGISVSTKALYQASTLEKMARHILERREEQKDEVDHEFDWAAEVAVPTSLLEQVDRLSLSAATPSSKSTRAEKLEVLLSGSTGFLGGSLLRRLLQLPAVNKVHCIAVPTVDQHLLADGQLPDDKIDCYTGNLASPDLGLSALQRKHLEQTVDIIIHVGAKGHCLNTYPTLRAPNLFSTHSLASIALARSPPIPFLFVSSNRVALLSGSTSPPPASLAAFPPPTDSTEGYTASKWASEAFLENLAMSLKQKQPQGVVPKTMWKASIHRPCVLISEQAPNSDALNAILRFSVSMRCVPWLPKERARGYLDFGQVDKVVEEITEAALQLVQADDDDDDDDDDDGGHVGSRIEFRHHSGGTKVPIHEFRAHMESVYGFPFDQVDLSEWIERAVNAGMDPLISAYLETLLESEGPLVFPYLGEKAH